MNICTHKNRSYNTSAVNIPPDSLNDHFLLLPSRLLQSLMENSDPDGYVCTSSLLDFCKERRAPSHAFHIPLLSVYEVGKLITGLKREKKKGPDDIPARLLKLAFPYIVEPFTYISRVTDQNDVSRIFDIFTFLHENVQQCAHFNVMTLILLSDH